MNKVYYTSSVPYAVVAGNYVTKYIHCFASLILMIAKILSLFKLAFVVIILASESTSIEVDADRKSLVKAAVEKACKVGNLSELRAELQEGLQFDIGQESLAAGLHTLSNLALIMDADASKAVVSNLIMSTLPLIPTLCMFNRTYIFKRNKFTRPSSHR
jgi:hypothetical protein